MRLYGNDIDESTTVLESGLEWTVSWTKPDFIGRGLPRFSGAIGWLLVLAMASLVMSPLTGLDLGDAAKSWPAWATTVWAISVFPPALVGHALSGRDAFILLPGASASTFAVAAAVWSIGRRDIPLEAAQ